MIFINNVPSKEKDNFEDKGYPKPGEKGYNDYLEHLKEMEELDNLQQQAEDITFPESENGSYYSIFSQS